LKVFASRKIALLLGAGVKELGTKFGRWRKHILSETIKEIVLISDVLHTTRATK
jgi:hypothetical protein